MIWELRHKHRLSLLLEISGLPRATYYYCIKHRAEPDNYSEVKEQVTTIFAENRGRLGYRRVTLELQNRGYHLNHKTVQRLMKSLGLICLVRMKKYKPYKGEVGKIAPNLLERNFEADKPNKKWVTDVTEFSLYGQTLPFTHP